MLRMPRAFPAYPAFYATTATANFRAAYPNAVVLRATFSMADRDVTVLVRTTAFRMLYEIGHEQDALASEWSMPQSITQDGPARVDASALRRLLPVLQRVLLPFDPGGRLDLTARAALAFYKGELQREVTVDVHRLLAWFWLMSGTSNPGSHAAYHMRPYVLTGVGIAMREEYVVSDVQLAQSTVPLAWNTPPPVVWRDEPLVFERVREVAADNVVHDAATDAATDATHTP